MKTWQWTSWCRIHLTKIERHSRRVQGERAFSIHILSLLPFSSLFVNSAHLILRGSVLRKSHQTALSRVMRWYYDYTLEDAGNSRFHAPWNINVSLHAQRTKFAPLNMARVWFSQLNPHSRDNFLSWESTERAECDHDFNTCLDCGWKCDFKPRKSTLKR